MLQIALYDPKGITGKEIEALPFWKKFNKAVLTGNMTADQIEQSVMKHETDAVLAVYNQSVFSHTDFIGKLLSNYPDTAVILIGETDSYDSIRSAFLHGAFDYLTINNFTETLQKTIIRMTISNRDLYFSQKIYDKVLVLARHIFDGGSNVSLLVNDIVDTIFNDWNNDSVSCQQVIERVKLESYKYFVRKKPWLEKFIYKGDYIRDIGFEIKSRNASKAELFMYYSEVNKLFQKYNVIDVNKTIYTIGKAIIHQVDEKITLASVAKEVYLNKTYVSHIFKEMTGISFGDFVLDVKIDRAKTLLHYPDMSISEISEILHFCNTGYFSKVFKSHTGITCSTYKAFIKNSVT